MKYLSSNKIESERKKDYNHLQEDVPVIELLCDTLRIIRAAKEKAGFTYMITPDNAKSDSGYQNNSARSKTYKDFVNKPEVKADTLSRKVAKVEHERNVNQEEKEITDANKMEVFKGKKMQEHNINDSIVKAKDPLRQRERVDGMNCQNKTWICKVCTKRNMEQCELCNVCGRQKGYMGVRMKQQRSHPHINAKGKKLVKSYQDDAVKSNEIKEKVERVKKEDMLLKSKLDYEENTRESLVTDISEVLLSLRNQNI